MIRTWLQPWLWTKRASARSKAKVIPWTNASSCRDAPMRKGIVPRIANSQSPSNLRLNKTLLSLRNLSRRLISNSKCLRKAWESHRVASRWSRGLLRWATSFPTNRATFMLRSQEMLWVKKLKSRNLSSMASLSSWRSALRKLRFWTLIRQLMRLRPQSCNRHIRATMHQSKG